MGKQSKRLEDYKKSLTEGKAYDLEEAIDVVKGCPPVRFDQSVEITIRTGVDPRKSDQNVRGTVSLPHGTGKKLRLLALVKGERVQEALDAGADMAGSDEYVEKIKGGWVDFDALVTTPDMMREVGKLGKILGPRGLMPTPKAGSVTTDIAKAVQEIKSGKVEFKLDRHGVISNAVGKLSFSQEQIKENIEALLRAIQRAKPATTKGQYLKSAAISCTMGPGCKLDRRHLDQGA